MASPISLPTGAVKVPDDWPVIGGLQPAYAPLPADRIGE
jgi:hypothetical protein